MTGSPRNAFESECQKLLYTPDDFFLLDVAGHNHRIEIFESDAAIFTPVWSAGLPSRADVVAFATAPEMAINLVGLE